MPVYLSEWMIHINLTDVSIKFCGTRDTCDRCEEFSLKALDISLVSSAVHENYCKVTWWKKSSLPEIWLPIRITPLAFYHEICGVVINETSLAHSEQKAEISKSVGVDANFDGVQSFSFNVVTLFSFPQLSVCFTGQIYSYANLSLRILKFSFKSANIGCETPLKMQSWVG